MEQTHSLLQFIGDNDLKSRNRALRRKNKAATAKRSRLNRPQPPHPSLVQIDRASGRDLQLVVDSNTASRMQMSFIQRKAAEGDIIGERHVSSGPIIERAFSIFLPFVNLPHPLNRIRLSRRLIRPQAHDAREAERVSALVPVRLHHVVECYLEHDLRFD